MILVPGLLYMIFASLGSIPHWQSDIFNQKLSSLLVFEIISLVSFAAIFSLWIAFEKYLNEGIVLKYSISPYIYAGVIAGIVISMAALLELFFPGHYLKQLLGVRDNTAFLSMFIFGLPLCLPAIHLLIIGWMENANQLPRSGAP